MLRYNIMTGMPIQRFSAVAAHVWDAVATPDGRTVVIAANKRLLAFCRGTVEPRIFDQTAVLRRTAVVADGSVAAAATTQTVCLFDLAEDWRIWKTPALSSSIDAVAFLPDGRSILAAGHDGLVRTLDAATGAERGRMSVGLSSVTCLSVSASGTTAAASGNSLEAVVWDLED